MGANFQFQTGEINQREKSLQLYLLEQNKETETRYYSASVFIHFLLFASALLASVFHTPPPKSETIEFEISASPMAPPPPPQALHQIQSDTEEKTEGSVKHISVPKVLNNKVQKAKANTTKIPTIPKNTSLKAFRHDSTVNVPATLDDIETPELDQPVISVPSKITATDLEKEIKNTKVDTSQLIAENSKVIEDEAASADSETQELADEIRNQNQQSAAAILFANKARRSAELAHAKGLLAAQEREGVEKRGSIINNMKKSWGEGISKNGTNSGQNNGPATNGLIRKLEDLRQKPGNPIPQYANEERLVGQQGQINFVGFVNKDGVLTQLKMIRSTGYTNLDSKTLAALKQWRFFPGQEGWVEIPFRWDLRGGAKEMPAMLKRAANK